MTENARTINFMNKNDLLLSSLRKYYKDEKKYTKIIKILNNETRISLRIIDWFITNYSKKHNIIYEIFTDKNNNKHYKYENIENPIRLKQFIVYMNYKSQLKAYSKKQFDPFCRRERIEFSFSKDNKIVTTIGQLNFFKWAIDNLILEYISDNLETIENDMNFAINGSFKKSKKKSLTAQKTKNKTKIKTKNKTPKKIKTEINKKKPKTKRKKRNELSVSASRGLNKHNVKVVLDFA